MKQHLLTGHTKMYVEKEVASEATHSMKSKDYLH